MIDRHRTGIREKNQYGAGHKLMTVKPTFSPLGSVEVGPS